MLEIRSDGNYTPAIRQFLQTQFPSVAVQKDGDILELLTDAILASGKVRLGPKPKVESLFEIRKHVQHQVDNNQPIHFLMPWGSEKPVDNQVVDLAEIGALKTLLCLNERVHKFYSPGIGIRIRVEDATAPSLFPMNRDKARINARIYSDSFEKLVSILEMDSFIQVVRETSLISEDDFEGEFNAVSIQMLRYLLDSEGVERPENLQSFKTLERLGWKGTIPHEQREYYRGVYRKLYGFNEYHATEMLARYLAQSLCRVRLQILGNKNWSDYIGLSFVGPVPGEPKNRTAKRIYYRTLPEHVSTLHIPPWRAKGYLSISNDSARLRLASWSEPREYVDNSIELVNGASSVTVKSDYLITE